MTVWAWSTGHSSRSFHRPAPARRGRNHHVNIWSKSPQRGGLGWGGRGPSWDGGGAPAGDQPSCARIPGFGQQAFHQLPNSVAGECPRPVNPCPLSWEMFSRPLPSVDRLSLAETIRPVSQLGLPFLPLLFVPHPPLSSSGCFPFPRRQMQAGNTTPWMGGRRGRLLKPPPPCAHCFSSFPSIPFLSPSLLSL